MDKFIIGFGYDAEPAIVYAPSLDAARQKAITLSLSKGLSVEDANEPDYSWAAEFDPWLAKDLGLMWLDEKEARFYEAEARP